MKEFKIFKLVQKTYDNLLSDIAKKYSLTLNELKILLFLKDSMENIYAKDIVEDLGSTKSHISMSLNTLEEKQYIIKYHSDLDKKKCSIKVTPKSIPIIEEAEKTSKEIKRIMSDSITKEENEVLDNVCKKILYNLEEFNKQKNLKGE